MFLLMEGEASLVLQKGRSSLTSVTQDTSSLEILAEPVSLMADGQEAFQSVFVSSKWNRQQS